MRNTYTKNTGFTIVELLIVVVVIAILAAITIVAYNGVSQRAKQASAQTAAKDARTKILAYAITNNEDYPADLTGAGLASSTSTTLTYSVDNSANPKYFCITATSSAVSYYVSNTVTTPTSGTCPPTGPVDGSSLQTITTANCPSTRIRAVDARDNHTYWVQKLSDGKCWMLTNLGYAGGGTNTYGDVKTLQNGTSDSGTSYTLPKYYIPPSTVNYTTEPASPSVSTNGTGQYGYLYNWCAAMGAQATAACANATTPTPDPTITICPAGWRLPTGTMTTGEFALLNTAINSGSTTSPTGLRSNWLGQSGGYRQSGAFYDQGAVAMYRSSTQNAAAYSLVLYFINSTVNTAGSYSNGTKAEGLAVRCLAN